MKREFGSNYASISDVNFTAKYRASCPRFVGHSQEEYKIMREGEEKTKKLEQIKRVICNQNMNLINIHKSGECKNGNCKSK
jgi:hypothetical protein